jgi:hypothetical protein
VVVVTHRQVVSQQLRAAAIADSQLSDGHT